jgi:hypothetical protein
MPAYLGAKQLQNKNQIFDFDQPAGDAFALFGVIIPS